MIEFSYDEKKTIQIIAYLLKKPGKEMKNYTKIIKLLYLIDRAALKLYNMSLTGDSMYSLSLGPILSKTYDRIKSEFVSSYREWKKYFIKKDKYNLEILCEPGIDELSKKDIEIIEKIYSKFKDYNYSEMIEFCHFFLPEWDSKVGNSRSRIEVEDILRNLRKTEEQIAKIKEETENKKYLREVLNT